MADMLRGEEGSQVRVEVLGKNGQTRSLLIARRRVEVPSVDDVKMIDEEYHIGYFKITSFQKTTPRDVDAALWKLHEKGMRSLVIDLRGNPGGLLKAAVDVADKFVMDGMIVATRGRSPREDFDHKGQVVGTWRVPLNKRLPYGEGFLHLEYFQQRPSTLSVLIEDTGGKLVPPATGARVGFPVTLGAQLLRLRPSTAAAVVIKSDSAATNICIGGIVIGAPFAPRR